MFERRIFIKLTFISLLVIATTILYCNYSLHNYNVPVSELKNKIEIVKSELLKNSSENVTEDEHSSAVSKFFNKRLNWSTSNLGAILFKNASPSRFVRKGGGTGRRAAAGGVGEEVRWTVVVWRYWDWLQRRHLAKAGDPGGEVLSGCSVHNCRFVRGEEGAQLQAADAVIVHVQRGEIPPMENRNPKARWILLSDEAPPHTFSLAPRPVQLQELAGVFNWTMTYRSESDVPVPYGRTVPRPRGPLYTNMSDPVAALAALVPHWTEKSNRGSMVIMSNCLGFRLQFIRTVQEYFPVDVYGKCAEKTEYKNACPGHFHSECALPADYLFYLALENSNCSQYLTEKLFHHAYSKGAIPLIMGPSLQDCQQLLPPHSYLHVANYETIKDLADEMTSISESEEKILQMHSWRQHFEVLGEHGFFGTKSYHYCRVCEALNYNDASPKTYSLNDLKLFFDINLTCNLNYGKDNFMN